MQTAEIGIIGGSGLYAMPGLTNVREERVDTVGCHPIDEPGLPPDRTDPAFEFVVAQRFSGRKRRAVQHRIEGAERAHLVFPSELLKVAASVKKPERLGD